MTTREMVVKRGLRLEYLTVGWNSLEALIALIAGLMAGSIVLVGFALDSVIEVSSGGVLLWRLHSDRDVANRSHVEDRALRLVGMSFLLLVAYLSFEAIKTLVQRKAPEVSLSGIVLAIAALIVMPLLAHAKRRIARELQSGSLHADSRQTDFCAYLSAIMLAGLLLNALWGWWWADPAAALIMVPLIAKEGVNALQGNACCERDLCGTQPGALHVRK